MPGFPTIESRHRMAGYKYVQPGLEFDSGDTILKVRFNIVDTKKYYCLSDYAAPSRFNTYNILF